MSEIFIAATLILLIWGIVIYNRLVSNKNRTSEGWSDIDVQLKRRHNLIPNLVTITKQYAKFEQAVLTTVTELRSQSQKVASIETKGVLEEELNQGIHQLIALVEQYPDLKTNENFIKLQEELVDIEEHIQYARRYYNGAVRNLNISIERFPNLIVAKLFSFKQSDFFQLESEQMRKAVRVG